MSLLYRLVLLLTVGLTVYGIAIIGESYPFAVLFVGLAIVARRFRGWQASGWAYGTARIATLFDAARGKLLSRDGLILGRATFIDPPGKWQAVRGLMSFRLGSDMACRHFLAAFTSRRWTGDRLLRVKEFIHLASFGPAGAGKGVSVLVPNLLSYRLSCVILDPKGELWGLTAAHRRAAFMHTTLRLDPFEVHGRGGACLNPLAFLNPAAATFLDDCRAVANSIVTRLGTEPDGHWNDAAEMVITGFIAFICACEPKPEKRNLCTLRRLVSSPDRYDQAIAAMRSQPDACGGIIARLGDLLSWFEGEERGSVMTTVQRFTAFLDSAAVARCVETSSFDPRVLRSGKASLYLILPPDKLSSLAALQRLWLNTIIRVITQRGADERHPVLFLLDEIAHCGKIQVIEDAVTLMRGMGIRLWFFFQSIDQMKKCFGDRASTILDNIRTQQYFGITSYESAETVSKRIGDASITIGTFNRTTSSSRPTGGDGRQSQGGSISTSDSYNYSETGRRLLRPEEIICLRDDMALVLHKNLPVICSHLLKYYDAPEFANGGTAAPRRLGFFAGLVSLFLLFTSFCFVGVAIILPQIMPTLPQPTLPDYRPGAGPGDSPYAQPSPYNTPSPYDQSGPYGPPYGGLRQSARRYQTNAERDLPSRSGFLIPIR